ncbi:hypothetical protein OG936_08610 [Streptomyces sp. NBC_00846]|uniref:hypothetical protein n=1 Tax=Streptomyces sp. NBC_00846 TaxID=2975849 RepID=UPI00386B1EE6|nr:hypothetical protein OG936_08610 [Streptomyces sp. NBC_00846]
MMSDDREIPAAPDWDEWRAREEAEGAARHQNPYGAPEVPRDRRGRWRNGLITAIVVAAVATGAVLYLRGDGGGATDAAGNSPSRSPAPADRSPAPSAPAVSAQLPADAPSVLPSLLARPIVRPGQAFPEKTVRLADGTVYNRVDVATTTNCERGMSQELAQLIAQGKGCEQLTAALYTDSARRAQVTVSVLSFRRAEDSGTVFAMASMDPVTYQVVSLDPPPGAGLQTVPAGSAGVFKRLATVRSVVFANAQWSDGAESREAELTKADTDLLTYVNKKVTAYETAGAEQG